MFRIIRNYLLTWLAIFGVLLIYSCIRYREQIAYTVSNNLWACINGIMPPIIIILGILYAIRCAFRR